MEFKFNSLPELIKRFPDDATARHYFESLRWNGCPECPFCCSNKYYKLNDAKTYKCGNKECRKKYTVTTNTVFHSSHIPLHTWFAAIYLISAHKKGISSHQIARDLAVTQKTAWFMLHRIREMVKVKNPAALVGTVEVDETYVGGKVANKHKSQRAKYKEKLGSRLANKTPVVGMVERSGAVRSYVWLQNNMPLKDMVRQHVSTEAVVVTDSLYSYRGLDKEYKAHEVVNHDKNEYKREEWHTNTVEGFFSHLKRSIYGIYHQVSPKHLQRYCDEVSFRYNSRKVKDNARFELTLSKPEGRLKYSQLTAK